MDKEERRQQAEGVQGASRGRTGMGQGQSRHTLRSAVDGDKLYVGSQQETCGAVLSAIVKRILTAPQRKGSAVPTGLRAAVSKN